MKERDAPAADDKRRKTNGGIETEMKERATGSSDPAVYEEMEVGIITEEFSEEMIVEMMACWIEGTGEYAWDDVNNIALPLQLVKEARKEEMGHMKGKIVKVVKKGRGVGGHRQGSDKYEVGGHRQDPRDEGAGGEVEMGG